jgi:hypothetical protein
MIAMSDPAARSVTAIATGGCIRTSAIIGYLHTPSTAAPAEEFRLPVPDGPVAHLRFSGISSGTAGK